MRNIALLVVDVQAALIAGHPYNERTVVENIKKLVAVARKHKTEVIYVRHDDGKGEELEYGSDGWKIYSEVAPVDGEKVFDKRYNSAFKDTGLKEYLEARGADTLVLTGLQTEYCIDATIKVAFEYGFKLMIPEGTNTTFDNDYMSGERLYEFYNHKIWDTRFASVVTVEDTVRVLARGKKLRGGL
jgi:nicotinamidase-related amidase